MNELSERMTRPELDVLLRELSLSSGETTDQFFEQVDRDGSAAASTDDGLFVSATLVSIGGPRIYSVVMASDA